MRFDRCSAGEFLQCIQYDSYCLTLNGGYSSNHRQQLLWPSLYPIATVVVMGYDHNCRRLPQFMVMPCQV